MLEVSQIHVIRHKVLVDGKSTPKRVAVHGGLRKQGYEVGETTVRSVVNEWKEASAGRELTRDFAALAAHYAFEPCFARPGEGHDKGGVESRAKNIRLQHLTPVPRGKTLEELSEQLLARLDEQARTKTCRTRGPIAGLVSDEITELR